MASLPSLAAILKRRQKTSARPFTLLNANVTGAKERTGLGTNAVRVTLGAVTLEAVTLHLLNGFTDIFSS